MKAGLILLLFLKMAAGPGKALPPAKYHPGFPGAEYRQAAEKHGVDPILLYAIVVNESGGRGEGINRVTPWPYALHFNNSRVRFYADTRREAEQLLKLALKVTDNIDVGLGQVNWKSHKDKVLRPQDLLDPKTNLEVASQILAEALSSTKDPELGVGRYNSWNEKKARRYGRDVLIIYHAIKETVKGG